MGEVKLRIELYGLESDPADDTAPPIDVYYGLIELRGKKLVAVPFNPRYKTLFDNVLNTGVLLDDDTIIRPDKDPVGWLKNAHQEFRGAYLRATKVI